MSWPAPVPTPLIERVNRRLRRIPGGCWVWTGALNSAGYGVIGLGGRSAGVGYVHRVMFERAHGPIPEGLEVDHLCRTRSCANPAHLEAVTRTENNRRMLVNRNRVTHCKRGHDLADAYVKRDGGRDCQLCRALRNAGCA